MTEDVPHITGWNVYYSTAPDAKPAAFIPAEDVPGMTLEAEISLYLQRHPEDPGKAADEE